MPIDWHEVTRYGGISKGVPSTPVSSAKLDRAVYAHVSERDGLRCRACSTYGGYDIHRHHLRGRKHTTHEDVCCLCDDCHDKTHVRLGGKTLKVYGDAEVRNQYGVPCGLTVEHRRPDGSWWTEVGR
jgi:hypothetical protein